jgi:hypothetical protein
VQDLLCEAECKIEVFPFMLGKKPDKNVMEEKKFIFSAQDLFCLKPSQQNEAGAENS